MTTQTLTITEFLTARIAEDEAQARDDYLWAMTGTKWKHYPEDAYNEIQSLTLANSRRVLAECEAKRRIVEAYRGLRTMASNFSNEGANGEAGTARAMYAGLDLALRALASVYADHEDFREEWRL
jgi:hypothetical protein